MKNVSKDFLKMAEVYKYFASSYVGTVDFSETALHGMYAYESLGEDGLDKTTNGYFIGKHWMDTTIKMWIDDIEKGFLFKFELYKDQNLPKWFLDKVVGSVQQGRPW